MQTAVSHAEPARCVRQRDTGGRVRRQRPLAKVLGDTECPSLSHAMTAAGRVRLGRCERRCCGRDCARGLRAAALSASGPRTAVSPAPPGLGLPALLRAAGRVGPACLPVSSPAGPPTSAWTGPRRSRVASSRPVLAQNVGGLSCPGLGPPPRRRQGPAGTRVHTPCHGAPAEPHPDVALRSRGHVWGARPVRTRSRALHAPLT